MDLVIAATDTLPPEERRIEIVERKGLGHPDTVCDALAESLSLALSRFYREYAGRILHHNVDKVLLVAGVTEPRLGGGRVVEPIRILLAGRAVLSIGPTAVPIAEIARESARDWLGRNLHALDPERHVAVECLVRPGSSELVGIFDEPGAERAPLANDTSCGVGYAPLSELERVVLAVEQRLNDPALRAAEPALGEDVKVMGVRRDDVIELTIGCAMIDSALGDLTEYAKARERAGQIAVEAAQAITARPVTAGVNVGDDLAAARVFLTVTGTSAEAGDDGQAGRGNRVNGLITPGRAMTIESVAGKNPVSHVGKLYNLTAGLLAERLVAEVPGVRSAECRLVSRIGHPIMEPWLVEVRVAGADPEADPAVRGAVDAVVREELACLPRLAGELIEGHLALDRWPLRV